ncbi:hypothetical protein [Sinorhizobium meliloti]|uniref:hypothetical protein n=1 Tax=Rhizobium meliloti TaxID=382 RepID=UPI00398D21AD
MRIEHVQLSPDHQFRHFPLAEACRRPGPDHAAVPKHGDAVGKRLNLIETMGDVEHRNPVIAQAANDVEQRHHFVVRENRSRLVEDDDLSLVEKGTRDLHELALGERQLTHTVARPGR